MVSHRYGYWQSLVVTQASRRQHIERRLVKAAEPWARQEGATEMKLDVGEFDAEPVRFYEKTGYLTLKRTLVREMEG